MSGIDLVISGKFLNSNQDELKGLIIDSYKEAAESLKETIKQSFESSVDLASLAGQYADPEALKAILRSVKVEVTNDWPPNLDIKFKDDLNYWYGGELPQDLIDKINNIYDEAIARWTLEKKFEDALLGVMGK